MFRAKGILSVHLRFSARGLWLAVLAFALQFLLLRTLPSDAWARPVLALSSVLLVLCVAMNLRNLPFLVMGAGLSLNLLVIYGNGGLMPIAPGAVRAAELPGHHRELIQGERFGAKNVLLDPQDTRFYLLSDRNFTDFPRPLLYSIGDGILALGLLLWMGAGAWEALQGYRERRSARAAAVLQGSVSPPQRPT